MRGIAIAMQKGGVGKTTSAAHIAAALADIDYRVLLVDLDPQCQQAQIFGVAVDLERTIYQVLMKGEPIQACAYRARNFDLLPSSQEWFTADSDLSGLAGPMKFRKALEQVSTQYDFVVMDTPPNLGALTSSALVAATDLIIPVQTHLASLNELAKFVNLVNQAREFHNPDLCVLGILPTMFQRTNTHDKQVLELMRANPVGYTVLDPIPRTVRIADCFARQMPTYDYDREAGWSYEQLVQRLFSRTPQEQAARAEAR